MQRALLVVVCVAAAALSQGAFQTTTATPATGLRLVAGSAAVTATWDAARSAPDGSLVHRREAGSGTPPGHRIVSGTRLSITGLRNGTRYVVAVDTSPGSPPGPPHQPVFASAAPVEGAGAGAARRSRPNIVVILVDDPGHGDVGYQGLTDFGTPDIESPVRSGIQFTRGCVTSPVCSPSRAGLPSGLYQQRFGRVCNIEFRRGHGLPTRVRLLPSVPRQAGYVTGIVGKRHLGDAGRFHPVRSGFDELCGFAGGGHDYFRSVNNRDSRYMAMLCDNARRVPARGYLTDQFTEEAVECIARRRARPFFLHLACNAPHSPLQAPERALEEVARIRDEGRRAYAAMVRVLDGGIGSVMRQLASHGPARD